MIQEIMSISANVFINLEQEISHQHLVAVHEKSIIISIFDGVVLNF